MHDNLIDLFKKIPITASLHFHAEVEKSVQDTTGHSTKNNVVAIFEFMISFTNDMIEFFEPKDHLHQFSYFSQVGVVKLQE